MSPRQFRISRMMVLIAGIAVLFALPPELSVLIGCVVVTVLYGCLSARIVARFTGPGPGRPYARENVPAMAQVAWGLTIVAWLVSIATTSAFGRQYAAVLVPLFFLAVLLGAFSFVLALSAMMAGGERQFFWRVAALGAVLGSVAFYIGIALGLLRAVFWLFTGH